VTRSHPPLSSARRTLAGPLLAAAVLAPAFGAPAFWAPTPARAAEVHAEVQTQVLSNGLTVVLREEHKAPVISFQVWYKVGSRNEETGRTGLSHMLEHMMFKGTTHHPVGDFSRIVAREGGNENAFTSRDYTAYFTNWAPENLPLSVELESDRMANLVVDPKEFAPEHQVVGEERRMRIDDNPIMATMEQLYAAAYTAHPYGEPPIGWMSDIQAYTADDVAAYYRRYYAPNNATVVVVGDFDSKTALDAIRKGFGAIPRGPELPVVRAEEPGQPGERRAEVHRPAQLPFVFIAWHAPNWESPDAYPLAVLGRILFEGKRSRIYQRLIYTDQIAVDAGGDYDPMSTDPMLFYCYGAAAPGQTPEAVEAALNEEIARLRTSPPEARELARAKNQVEAEYLMAQDSVFYQAMQLGEAASVGAGVGYVEDFPRRIREVTAEQVQEVATKYLNADGRTVAVLVPEAGAVPAPMGMGASGVFR
jgi:zinc protease